jgi:hypothetical protein
MVNITELCDRNIVEEGVGNPDKIKAFIGKVDAIAAISKKPYQYKSAADNRECEQYPFLIKMFFIIPSSFGGLHAVEDELSQNNHLPLYTQ